MNESQADNVLGQYEHLERQLVQFKRFVPPLGQNQKTWSPRLATVVVESCILLDSIFRHASCGPIRMAGRRINRQNLKLPHYCRLYSPKYNLANRKVILLSSPPEYRTPFVGWAEHSAPAWWDVHNDLKHDRIPHLRRATWEMAIDALAGLLLVITFMPDFTMPLMRRNWIDFRVNPEIFLRWAKEGYPSHTASWLHTSFFAIPLGGDPLPGRIEDLRPANYGATSWLITFFGRI